MSEDIDYRAEVEKHSSIRNAAKANNIAYSTFYRRLKDQERRSPLDTVPVQRVLRKSFGMAPIHCIL